MYLEFVKKEFERFVGQYDLKNKKMESKHDHSYRVMNIAIEIAKSIKLSDEEVDLAGVIGLLHDIGRFEQERRFETFKDHISIDHGDLGEEILKKDNYIRKFIEEDTYDNIIFKAVKNHNKYKIEEGLSEKELLFSKIIRDADKLDIFYEGAYLFWNDQERIDRICNSTITDKVLEEFQRNSLIDKRDMITEVDGIVSFVGFMYDINFKYDFEVLKKENYINIIFDKFEFTDEETAKKMKQIRKIANEYIEKQL